MYATYEAVGIFRAAAAVAEVAGGTKRRIIIDSRPPEKSRKEFWNELHEAEEEFQRAPALSILDAAGGLPQATRTAPVPIVMRKPPALSPWILEEEEDDDDLLLL